MIKWGNGYGLWLCKCPPNTECLPLPMYLTLFSGTSLFYHPGLLIGGTLEHDCSRQRSIGYFLEPLMMLAPFAKKPIHITLRGLTNGPLDPSVSMRLHRNVLC